MVFWGHSLTPGESMPQHCWAPASPPGSPRGNKPPHNYEDAGAPQVDAGHAGSLGRGRSQGPGVDSVGASTPQGGRLAAKGALGLVSSLPCR